MVSKCDDVLYVVKMYSESSNYSYSFIVERITHYLRGPAAHAQLLPAGKSQGTGLASL